MSFVHTCGHRCGELWITLSTALSTTGDNRAVSALETPRARPHYPPPRRTPGSTAVHSGVPGLWLTRSDGAPNSDSPHIIYSLRLHAVRTRGGLEASPSQDPERVIHRASGACGASKSTGLRRVGGSPSHIPVLDGSGKTAPWSYEGSPRRRTPTASARRTMRRLDSAGWERGAVDAPASPASPARAEPPRPSGAAPPEQHGRRQCGERYHPPGIPLRRRPPHPITTTTAPPSRASRWAESPRRRA